VPYGKVGEKRNVSWSSCKQGKEAKNGTLYRQKQPGKDRRKISKDMRRLFHERDRFFRRYVLKRRGWGLRGQGL